MNETIKFGRTDSELGETFKILFLACIFNKPSNRFTGNETIFHAHQCKRPAFAGLLATAVMEQGYFLFMQFA